MQPITNKATTIALMNGFPLLLDGLAEFIKENHESVEIVSQDISVLQASERLQYQQADVLITDLCGQNETTFIGCSRLLDLCATLPRLRVLVYTHCKESDVLSKLAARRSISLIERSGSISRVGGYLQRFLCGEQVISPSINHLLARRPDCDFGKLHKLTRSENDVLLYLFNGLSLGQIAERKNLSVKTISAHKCNAMRKLHLANDSELFSLRNSFTFL
ncbi:MAG TPA: LuxR C-terminal-related transcriptional regulator [Buttiauxella sp.]|jgi:two-component system capsular synthesis response regulator RcsB